MAKLWGAFRSYGESHQRNRRVFLATSPYFALRLAVSFPLELIGLSLVWAIRGVVYGPDRLSCHHENRPVFGALFTKVLGEPKGDSTDGTGKGFYRSLIRWALDSSVAMIALAAACFWVPLRGRSLETELLPEVHQSEFTFEEPVGTLWTKR